MKIERIIAGPTANPATMKAVTQLRTWSPTSFLLQLALPTVNGGEARVLVTAVHCDSHSARVAMQAVCAHSSTHTDRTAAVSPPPCVPLQQLLFSPEDLDDASQDLPHYIRILGEFPSITPSPSQKHRSRWGGSQGPDAGMSERRMPWTSTAAGTSTAVMDVWRKKPSSALIHSFDSSCTAETVVNRYLHGSGDALDFCRALECIIAGFCRSRKRHGRKKLSGDLELQELREVCAAGVVQHLIGLLSNGSQHADLAADVLHRLCVASSRAPGEARLHVNLSHGVVRLAMLLRAQCGLISSQRSALTNDTARITALAMALHPRLGSESVASLLSPDLVQRIAHFIRQGRLSRLVQLHAFALKHEDNCDLFILSGGGDAVLELLRSITEKRVEHSDVLNLLHALATPRSLTALTTYDRSILPEIITHLSAMDRQGELDEADARLLQHLVRYQIHAAARVII